MITIIHGDNISFSRNYFLEEKQKYKSHVSLDVGNLSVTILTQNLEGSGLFEDTKTIFIEEFLTKFKKTGKEFPEIVNLINKNSEKNNIFFWESKEIGKKDLSNFKKAITKAFKLPQSIFLFLDNLRPQNSKNSLNLFHTTLKENVKEELILFMLQRQFRLLLGLSDNNSETQIDEIKRLAPWQMGKLQRQARLFSIDSLKEIYKNLYEVELGQKTGTLPLSLTQSIDFLLLGI